MTEKGKNHREWTVSEVLSSMSSSLYPEYVIKAAEQICLWMRESLDSPPQESTEEIAIEYEHLYNKLDWLKDHVSFLGESEPETGSEAVVISLETADLDDAMRIALDHVAIFSRGKCSKVWIISDTWLPGDVLRYRKHLEALSADGISFRFLLVTPEGWTEIPLYASGFSGKKSLPWNDDRSGETV